MENAPQISKGEAKKRKKRRATMRSLFACFCLMSLNFFGSTEVSLKQSLECLAVPCFVACQTCFKHHKRLVK